ncbi:emb-5 [Symbiodinium sp. KB8]|nr:emb-5 [Symbiodinium sp. KB8]
MAFDPIFEQLSLMYCVTIAEGGDRRAVMETSWNSVRRNMLRKALLEELYPTMWAEVKDHLARTASAVVCRDVRERLTKMVDIKPPPDTDKKLDEAEDKVNDLRQDSDDEAAAQRKREDPSLWEKERLARKAGLHSALVILPEVGIDVETAIVGFVNAFGEPVDMRQVFKSCLKIQHNQSRYEKGSFNYDKDQKIFEHKAIVENLIATHKPSFILLAVTDPEIMRLKASLENLLNREQKILANLKVLPKIKFVDPTVPRAVAYHKRVLESPAYRDFPTPAHRIAISCARFFQDPLAETCQLWHELPDENGLFKVNLHHLQHDVPRELFGRTITQTLQEVFAKCGLYINKVRRSPHLESLIQFVPGLGPRKARIFHKVLTDSVKSRATVQDIMSKQLGVQDAENNAVLKNMYPFTKIQPDFRDGWLGRDREECASLERVRIAPQLYHWVNALCKDALLAQSDKNVDDTKEEDMEGDLVGRVMDLLRSDANFVNVIQDQDWSTWHERAGEMNVPDSANLDKLFETILEELQEPYKDNRQVEENEMPGTELFYLALAERTEAFAAGSVVRGSVTRDEEYPDREVEANNSKTHRVHVRLAGGNAVNGVFQKEYKQSNSKKTGHIPGCNRHFTHGEPILARVREITSGRMNFTVLLSVDHDEEQWFDLYPVQSDDIPYFLPEQHDDWTKVTLGLLDNTEMQRKAKVKDWIRRPRNIKHPNYVPGDHEHAVKTLNSFFLGTVLFRSSKHHDVLVAMLKVLPTQDREVASGTGGVVEAFKCYRRFDVFEKREKKSYGDGFEVAAELEVDGYLYRDFDEIIARHMDPIMDNLRLLQEHKRFGLRNGTLLEKTTVEQAMRQISSDNHMLHYTLLLNFDEPGHGDLLWCMQGRSVRHELIEITPRGFSLWKHNFDSLEQMISWFKKVGWRNAQKLRRDYKEDRKLQAQVLKDKRGDHADPEHRFKRHRPLGYTATTTSGLQTPSGQSARFFFAQESNAATPAGMRSPRVGMPGSVGAAPGSAPGSVGGLASPGYQYGAPQTPMNAATPVPMKGPGTPGHFHSSPATPAALLQGHPMAAPGSRNPTTPARGTPGATVPQTPPGALPGGPAAGTPGGAVPQTPAAAFHKGAAGTPGNAVPQTPMAAFTRGSAAGTPGSAVPQTPTAAFPRGSASGTPGGSIPHTPRTAVRGSAAGTAGGAIPQTPVAAFNQRGPAGGKPGGPMTPATRSAAGTPGGIIPETPIAAFKNSSIPQTPTAPASGKLGF